MNHNCYVKNFKGFKGYKSHTGVKGLLIVGSMLLLASVASVAEAAIFTIEYSGSVTTADISNNPLIAQVGDRIAGRYSFDDADNNLILNRFDFLPAASTDALDPSIIGSSEVVFRETGAPPNPFFSPQTSDAGTQDSARYSSFLALGRGGGDNGTFFNVNAQAFSYRSSGNFGQPNAPVTSIKGTINRFSLVDNVTPNLPTLPVIPTAPVPVNPTPALPNPEPSNPVPTSVPEPAAVFGLLLLAGLAGASLRRQPPASV